MYAFRVEGVNKHAKPILREIKLVFPGIRAQEVVIWQKNDSINHGQFGVKFQRNLYIVWADIKLEETV
jgi:hypothetical protein